MAVSPAAVKICMLLSHLAVTSEPYHLLHSIFECMKFTTPFSVPEFPTIFGTAFQNPLCYECSTFQISFNIFHHLFTDPLCPFGLFAPFAEALVPFLASPEFSALGTAILTDAVRASATTATSLVFESDLIDVLSSCCRDVPDPVPLACLLKWVVQKCDLPILTASLPKLAALFLFLISRANAHASRAMAACIARCPAEAIVLLPDELCEFVLNAGEEELPHEVFELVNAVVTRKSDFFLELMTRMPIVEWLVAR
jgi:hypothetical protein